MKKVEHFFIAWRQVHTWATANGYTFATNGCEGHDGSVGAAVTVASNEPVTKVGWRDAVVWCNAYSAKNSLTPVYCSDSGFTTPLMDSTVTASCDAVYVNWSASGYRVASDNEYLGLGRDERLDDLGGG